MADFLSSAVSFISGLLNNIIVSAIILLVGFIAGRLVGKLVERVMAEIEVNRFLYNSIRVKIPADEIMGSLVKFFIYIFSVIMALDALKLKSVFLSIAAVFLGVVILVSFVLALWDFVPNVFAGVFIHQKGLAHEGDVIRVNELEGRIKSIALVDTRVETKTGDVIFIPNSFIIKNLVVVRKRR